jgi:hypothetical protein
MSFDESKFDQGTETQLMERSTISKTCFLALFAGILFTGLGFRAIWILGGANWTYYLGDSIGSVLVLLTGILFQCCVTS